MQIDAKAGTFRARGRSFKAGDLITIDGSKGQVLSGQVKMIEDLVVGAVNIAIERAHKLAQEEIAQATSGFSMPPGLFGG